MITIPSLEERLKSYEPFWTNWKLDSYLSKGSFASVYRLRDERLDEYSALKVITVDPSVLGGLRGGSRNDLLQLHRDQAENEIRFMTKLKHCPFIVHCRNYDFKELRGEKNELLLFDILIQMDLHTCLEDYIRDNDLILSEAEVVKFLRQVGAGLKAAHDIDIMHRDIKPGNIYINSLGDYLLGDLGISKQHTGNSYSTVAGNPEFMAPEIWRANTLDRYNRNADIYSLALVAYTFLNNNLPPFVSDNSSYSEEAESISRRMNGEPLPMPANGSPALNMVLLKACSFDPANRYQDMGSFLAAVESTQTGAAPGAVPAVNRPAFDQIQPAVPVPPPAASRPGYQATSVNTMPQYGAATVQINKRKTYLNMDRKRSKMPIIIAVIVVLVLAAAAFFVVPKLLNNGKDDPSEESDIISFEESEQTSEKLSADPEDQSDQNSFDSSINTVPSSVTETESKPEPAAPVYTPVYVPDVFSSFDLSYAEEYSEKKDTNGEFFQMSGSEYRNGVVFNNTTIVYKTSSITYNVLGDYSNLSFYLGHLDNTHKSPIELSVYLDNVLYEKYSMNADDPPKLISIDVSGKSTIRFTSKLDEYTGYCLANMALDEDSENIAPKPNVNNSGSAYVVDSLKSFDLSYAEEYSEKKDTNGESFQMSGSEYRNGVVFNNTTIVYQTSSITYNVLGDYSNLSFYLGHLDNTHKSPIELSVYLDNVLYEKYSMNADDPPKLISIDVSRKSTIRFTSKLDEYTGYCLANMVLDEDGGNIVPKPNVNNSGSAYVVDSLISYDLSYAEEYSEKKDTNGESFQMSGSEYRNGVVFNNTTIVYQTSSITYNVLGDYSNLSFYLGHLDNTRKSPIELSVYLDNVLYEKYSMNADDPPKLISIDVSRKSTIRFTSKLDEYTGYCLANMVLDEDGGNIVPKPNVNNSGSAYVVDSLKSFDLSYAEEYSEKKDTNGESFQMSGSEYRNGVVFNNTTIVYKTSSITYNVLGDYSNLSFYLGHLDNTQVPNRAECLS